MKNAGRLIPLIAMSLAMFVGLAPAQSPGQDQPGIDKQRKEADRQARPEIEKQRKDAEQQAVKAVEKEAAAAIDETIKAIKAIADNKPDQALAAIERATGKINILIARNSATALLPVDIEVEIIDGAPLDVNAIRERVKAMEKAIGDKNYPVARVLLDGLTSEIRVRTSHLPLATYPTALKEAAKLLDQKKNKEASAVLLTALHTLVVIDRVIPLPLAIAQAGIGEAQAIKDKDKAAAQKLLATARNELERSKELGYAGKDPEYKALDQAISSIEKQLQGSSDTASAFSKLKEKMAAFFKKQSENSHGSAKQAGRT